MRKQVIETVETVAGNISAPVYAYIGESGSGKDRRIKLEGATLFDKMLNLYKAGTYVSVGPAEGSREWNKLDKEDQSDYRILQARAKKRTTYKQMGEFLADICSANECFLFAIRQGDDAVWVNPKALKELLDNEWRGTDKYWIEEACGVWDYHHKEFLKWQKRFGKKESLLKKNERGRDTTTDLDGPACLFVSATTTTFDSSCDGDDVIGNVAISPADIEAAVTKIIDPKLWGAVKKDYDWKLLRETISDFGMKVGDVSGYSWDSPSQYFEDPGDGGYNVTLDLDNEQLSEAIDTLLYTFGQLVLDDLTGEPKYIEYGDDAKAQMLEEAKKDAEIQARLQELGLDFSAIDTLFSLDNSQAAQDIYNLLWALDGSEDSN